MLLRAVDQNEPHRENLPSGKEDGEKTEIHKSQVAASDMWGPGGDSGLHRRDLVIAEPTQSRPLLPNTR